jgi:VanZ family protein
MLKTKLLKLRRLRIVFLLVLVATIFAGLYPFNFIPNNRVQWLSNEPGLFFNGTGIAYTDMLEPFLLDKAISIQLLIKERRGSRNWGAKEILSFYDGPDSPPLLVGQWGGRIFLYSRFEKNDGERWYKLFRTKNRFPRGKDHFVTVTFDEHEKAIYIDGQLSRVKKVELKDKAHLQFSGRLIIGSSPRGKKGWSGEIKGLAIYNRILLPDQIAMHFNESLKSGIGVLEKTPGCVAVYLFDEGKGNSAESILSKTGNFFIPATLNAIALSSFRMSINEMRLYSLNQIDFLLNIAFFIPFGALLSVVIRRRYDISFPATFLIVLLTGVLLSCLIESLQCLLPTRSTDMTDILGNTLGSGIGMLAPSIFRWQPFRTRIR